MTLALSALGFGAEARADLWAGTGEGVPQIAKRRAILLADGRKVVVQETLELTGPRGRFARFVGVPSTPRFPPPQVGLETTLAEVTEHPAPRWPSVRAEPFGPSLAQRLSPVPSSEPDPPEPEPAALRSVARASFRGAVATSTRTRQPDFPPALDGFIARFGLEMTPSVRAGLAKYMNRGWVVVAAVYAPERPGPRYVLGPVRIEFEASSPHWPLARMTPTPTFELFTIADTPLVPDNVPFTWSPRPWRATEPRPGAAVGLGWATWPFGERGVPPWIGAAMTANRAVDAVTHVRYRPAREPYRDLQLAAATSLPDRPRRGTATDLFLTVLFGAVPVFAAPESWLLYLLQRRARARAKPTRVGWLTRAWFVWPMIVALDWLTSLGGAGRLAAALPIVIAGVAARPFVPDREQFVRARIEKKPKR